MESLRWPVYMSFLTMSTLVSAANNRDLYSLTLQELMDVRVTGSTLTALPIESVPNAITVFTRDDIRKLPVHTLEQLLELVPEVQSVRSTDLSGTSMISFRGRRISYSSRELLLLLNGMRVDNPHFGGFSTTYTQMPLDNVERVEIIRGPGSAIYGSNAFTGVINVITSDDEKNVTLAAGSHEWREASLQYSGTSNDKVIHSDIFISARDYGGEPLPVEDVFSEGTQQLPDPFKQLSLQWQLHFGNKNRLQLVFSEFRADGSYAGGVADEFNVNHPRYAGVMFEHDLDWHDDIKSKLQFGLQDWLLLSEVRPYTRIPVGSISDPLSSEPLYFKSEVKTREYWLRWQNDWQLSPLNSLQFGVEYRQPHNERVSASSNYDLQALVNGELPVTFYNNFDSDTPLGEVARMDIVGLYGQYQKRWSHAFETLFGLRYDSYGSVADSLSPRLGLIYHAGSHDTLKLLFSRAFRAPQFDERFAINNPVVLGNKDLESETVDTAELIWIHSWSDAWLSLNLFSNRFQDAIVLQPVGTSGVRMYDNSNFRSTSEGVSAELNSQLTEQLKLRLAATHFFEIPAVSYREATELFAASVIYSFNPWVLSLIANFNGERENPVDTLGYRETLDAYVLSHLKVAYTVITDNGHLQPYFEIRNLFDETYTTPSSTTFNPGGVSNHGRELRLGFVFDF